MSKKYNAVLIDMASIQGYIFNSNKLKLNIGASHIVEHEIYEDLLKSSTQSLGVNLNLKEWIENPHRKIENTVEVGYIGGGNALILFEEKQLAKEFVKVYSKNILKYFPGIKPVFAIVTDITMDDDKFQYEMKKIQSELRKNKQTFYRQTAPIKPGIIEECRLTGEMEEFRDRNEDFFISGIAKSKYQAFERAKDTINVQFSEQLKGMFEFPFDFSDMGIEEDKGYISLVHVDGNSMGKKFIECDTLTKFRILSAQMKEIGHKVLIKLVNHLVKLFENDHPITKEIKLKENNRKRYLPFRPIIAGGDDFTFVSEGRLGVYLTEKLMEFFKEEKVNEEELSSCGGIAIVKAKYPFFRAYNLCEQLTKQAKNLVKTNPTEQKNALHFLIAGSGFLAEDYRNLINEKFTVEQNKILINGPYYLESEKGVDNISNLKRKMHQLRYGDSKWPMSKIKELRNVLMASKSDQEYFIQTLNARGLKVKDITGFEDNVLWKKEGDVYKTPLFDLFELITFYPSSLLKEN